MTRKIDALEENRLALQKRLDSRKNTEDRNRMGQFATPTGLAREILRYGTNLLPKGERIRFLDPAIGTGSFYSALRAAVSAKRIGSALGFEIDPHYGEPAEKFWKDAPLEIHLADFTDSEQEGWSANLLICNPPYVRHHHLSGEAKIRLQTRTEAACGAKFDGLSGLYCYFMGLAHPWMAPEAVAGWLVPSEFMGVNYGRALKSYLLRKVTLLHIHRFNPDNAQFADWLVSSAVVWLRNAPPPENHRVLFTYGGTLENPTMERRIPSRDLQGEPKWTRYPQADAARKRSSISLGDLFDIKRGLVTGSNSFFIMDLAQIADLDLPMEAFRPVLPGSRHIPADEVHSDENGWPLLDRQLFLLDPGMSECEIARRHPQLDAYLQSGLRGREPVSGRYLCRSRNPWYAQENRPPAPIVCTYMGRKGKNGRPFRFILNNSRATACNTYLMMYPKSAISALLETEPEAIREIWKFLNGIETDELTGYGRVYGGGLHKLEPKELRGFPAATLAERLPELSVQLQGALF